MTCWFHTYETFIGLVYLPFPAGLCSSRICLKITHRLQVTRTLIGGNCEQKPARSQRIDEVTFPRSKTEDVLSFLAVIFCNVTMVKDYPLESAWSEQFGHQQQLAESSNIKTFLALGSVVL